MFRFLTVGPWKVPTPGLAHPRHWQTHLQQLPAHRSPPSPPHTAFLAKLPSFSQLTPEMPHGYFRALIIISKLRSSLSPSLDLFLVHSHIILVCVSSRIFTPSSLALLVHSNSPYLRNCSCPTQPLFLSLTWPYQTDLGPSPSGSLLDSPFISNLPRTQRADSAQDSSH